MICQMRLETLLESENDDLEFHFFWSGVFSQWYLSPFFYNRLFYPTAEHWMMWCKARLFNDTEIANKIMWWADEPPDGNPKEVKKLGREVANFDQGTWDKYKQQIVYYGNLLKFSQSPSERYQLLKTDDKVLVEASPYDKIWGIGMSESNEKARKPELWRGQNLLGFILMDVRECLK